MTANSKNKSIFSDGSIMKPWGYETIIQENIWYVVKRIYVKEGCRLSKQSHTTKIETLTLLQGEGWCYEYDEHGIELKKMSIVKGQFYHIPAGQLHRLSAGKYWSATFLEISSPHLDDVNRYEDDYGRVD